MEQNLFEELYSKKQALIELTKKAVSYGWISKERQQEILEKLETDVLTIGVIGQMKCGKSTFLNSFVFEDDVLPAAITPMTAALSVITYGEDKKIVAEFYTEDEWEEQKFNASRSLDDVQGNPLEESKVKAAKELVEKASKLGSALTSYLGKKQEDGFENLIEYVGADGKYIAITKSVTIYYPKEYLKGVEIVDTPGFNDPIVSREERTKAFLKKADVVLMMLYAGRPFDATDREILFQNVRQCGIGKVIIGINKYDIPYENGETEDEIKEYVKQEIKKVCKACGDDSLVELLKQTTPIPVAAEMALLSELSSTKINESEIYRAAKTRACGIFEISTPQQMREKSHLDDLAEAVKQMVENEKGKILFAKPFNAIVAAGNLKKQECEQVIRECDVLIRNLEKPDDELEELQKQLSAAKRKLNKKVDSLGDDIDSVFDQMNRRGKNDLEDAVDASCEKMKQIIKDWGRSSSIDSIISQLDAEKQRLVTRALKRKVMGLNEDAKTKIKACIQDFLSKANEILIRYVWDFDDEDFMKKVEKKIQTDIDDEDIFRFDNSSDDEEESFVDYLWDLLDAAAWGALGKIGNILNHDKHKVELENYVNSISRDFDPKPFLESIKRNKDKIINEVKECFITDLIEPMEEQIRKIRSEIKEKETALKEAKEKQKIYKTKKQEIENQLATINL